MDDDAKLQALLASLCESPKHDRISALASKLGIDSVLYVASDYNVGRRVGTAKALASLVKINADVNKLLDHLIELGTEARQQLEKSFRLSHGTTMQDVLQLLGKVGQASAETYDLIQTKPFAESRARKPKKNAARHIAEQCLEIFEELTGNPATIPAQDGKAYGVFLTFVSDVFCLLQIDGSPEWFGREAIRKEKARTNGR